MSEVKKIQVGVVGLWHLGVVLSACLNQLGYRVIAFDGNKETIDRLNHGSLPVEEPGISQIFAQALASKRIVFTEDPTKLKDCEIIWIAYDTPVLDDDSADDEYVKNQIYNLLPYIQSDAGLVISSQLPVGTTSIVRKMIDEIIPNNSISLAVSPENLRLGKALDSFLNSERIIVGIENNEPSEKFDNFFNSLNSNVLWMDYTSAEMVKHSLNTFLATCITFMAEISEICELVGADARKVELGLRTDHRIGKYSYLSPGLGFAGGTLARDVKYLNQIFKRFNEKTILDSLLPSNIYNNNWVLRKINEKFVDQNNLSIRFIGLTYTSGTNTLRRSAMLELANYLSNIGAKISYFDEDLNGVSHEIKTKFSNVENPIHNLDGTQVIIITKKMNWMNEVDLIEQLFNKSVMVIDPNGILANKVHLRSGRGNYFTVGFKSD